MHTTPACPMCTFFGPYKMHAHQHSCAMSSSMSMSMSMSMPAECIRQLCNIVMTGCLLCAGPDRPLPVIQPSSQAHPERHSRSPSDHQRQHHRPRLPRKPTVTPSADLATTESAFASPSLSPITTPDRRGGPSGHHPVTHQCDSVPAASHAAALERFTAAGDATVDGQAAE